MRAHQQQRSTYLFVSRGRDSRADLLRRDHNPFTRLDFHPAPPVGLPG